MIKLGWILAILGVFVLFWFGIRQGVVAPIGGSVFDPSFSNATSTTSVCGGTAPATIITATTTGRTSFAMQLTTNATQVQICRNSTCASATGIALVSSSPRYVQDDSYYGPYSCQAAASTTVSGWQSL